MSISELDKRDQHKWPPAIVVPQKTTDTCATERESPSSSTSYLLGQSTAKPSGLQIGGKHYKAMKIQPVEYIHANKIPFVEGSIIKYVSRWREKGGLQDLQKAKHFIDLLIELEEKDAK